MTKDKSFSYSDIIKTPDQMHSGTSAKDLGHNISALRAYSSLLLTSDSAANALEGHALGPQNWVRTNAKCKVNDTNDPNNGTLQQRYIYIDGQPHTNTPPNKNASTKNMEFNGLIPGLIDDIFKMMPSKLFTAFAEDGNPECVSAKLSVTDSFDIDKDGNKLEQHASNYITIDDLKNVSGCSFISGKNPYNKANNCPFTPAGDKFLNYNMPVIDKPKRTHLYCSRHGNRNNTGCINGKPDRRRYVPCGYIIKSSTKHNGGPKGEGLQGDCQFIPKGITLSDGNISEGNMKGALVPQNNPKEAFKNISKVPRDKAVHLYFTTLSIVALYILYCFIKKTSK
tara:strand:+ start:1733 stop:2749 length:1017 start_codon:yes stop_codon:yes gene_type:complete